MRRRIGDVRMSFHVQYSKDQNIVLCICKYDR